MTGEGGGNGGGGVTDLHDWEQQGKVTGKGGGNGGGGSLTCMTGSSRGR